MGQFREQTQNVPNEAEIYVSINNGGDFIHPCCGYLANDIHDDCRMPDCMIHSVTIKFDKNKV